jgi:hypothetical protein
VASLKREAVLKKSASLILAKPILEESFSVIAFFNSAFREKSSLSLAMFISWAFSE